MNPPLRVIWLRMKLGFASEYGFNLMAARALADLHDYWLTKPTTEEK